MDTIHVVSRPPENLRSDCFTIKREFGEVIMFAKIVYPTKRYIFLKKAYISFQPFIVIVENLKIFEFRDVYQHKYLMIDYFKRIMLRAQGCGEAAEFWICVITWINLQVSKGQNLSVRPSVIFFRTDKFLELSVWK